MELDLKGKHAPYAYKVLTSLITPRPIAWITSLNENGSVNVAPFSFFNVFGSKPPIIAFAPGNRPDGRLKDSTRNIKRTGEFVVHMVEEAQSQAMVDSSISYEAGISEVDSLGLTTVESRVISVPRVVESSVAFECKLHQTIEIGNNRMMVGLVEWTHVQNGVLDPIDYRLINGEYEPVGRMASPNYYCRTNTLFQVDPKEI